MTKSIEDFSEILQLEESLARHTWLRLGGPAQYFLTPRTEEELLAVIQTCREKKVPIHILGAGSNLLVREEGVRGAVIRVIEPLLCDVCVEGTDVIAGGGTLLSHMITEAVRAGLGGVEHLVGIPGTIAGNSGGQVLVQVPQGLSGQVNVSLNTAQGPAATVAGVQIDPPKADVAVERIFQAVNQSQKTIVYSITVTNKGPSTASNVVVNIGAGNVTGLLATQITPPSGATCNNTGSQCTIPT